ncbi:baculoviral IAP repeat-containing protein 7-A-like isoform X2 [Haliotis rufescens]|uniref:baculoviral IAP repeat-containing protein 7-A-like isoform X2 n=1 Tax=Haliotis rufescens TaxID=6454 RepID=UPI00201F9E69|nr:baculoviral IAP repeat-containing protein 7-A-like isoform X2 [Haliotis rufescens]XP_046370880.2 baculoviral IAP repeat-containing protein 7-A-like isoform X2 [Haliotis rufescens]XP_048239820.1 baculoviral IAP repeat-containing protein 7-A-like isoform X2 [Haliotis rufescens]
MYNVNVMDSVSNDFRSTSLTTTAVPQYLSVPELMAQPFTTSLTTYLGRVQMEGQVPVEEEMCHEIRRLQSFSGTPVHASPMRLAQSGFYATGREDEARCYSCRKSHTGWQIMDKPDVLHRVISPECPHLNRNEPRNIPLSSDSNGSTIYGILGEYSGSNNVTTTDTLPPTTTEIGAAAAAEAAPVVSESSLDMSTAVHPLYKDIQSRLDSYRAWNTSHVQDPQVLATAGFFYAGYSDCVRCFYCGVGLKTWEEGDDPWVEHVRWRSSCSYIRRLKGDNFVIQALTNKASRQPTVNNTHSSHRPATSLNAAVVARAVEMGYTRQMVERAVTEMSQSYNVPGAAGVTDQHPVQLEALIERLVIASEETDERQRMSDIPEERPRISDVPEERQRMSDMPEERHRMSDVAEERHRMSDMPEERPRMSDVPEERQRMSDMPEERHRMSDVPEERHRISDVPEERHRISDVPEERPRISDVPEERHRISDVPEERHRISDVPEERPRVSDVPEERHRMSYIPRERHHVSEVPQSLPARLAPLRNSTTASQQTSVTTPTVSSIRHPREHKPGTESSRSVPPSLQHQIKEENRALRDENTCKVCLDRSSCVVFLPCGHLVTCAECAPALRKCPICRSLIRGTVRTYNA